MGKTTWVQLRVTEDEKARIERLAKATGESVSSYLRRKALEEDDVMALRLELRQLQQEMRELRSKGRQQNE